MPKLIGPVICRIPLKAARICCGDDRRLDPHELYVLGMRYDAVGDYEQAYEWFRLAADKDVPKAQFMLGNYLYLGRGTRMDQAEAVFWLRKAAILHDADAQQLLGKCFDLGTGVP